MTEEQAIERIAYSLDHDGICGPFARHAAQIAWNEMKAIAREDAARQPTLVLGMPGYQEPVVVTGLRHPA